jgi:hypothetical protein
LHRANATAGIALGLLGLACARHNPRAALGWSLGGEAHVFVAGDRFAKNLYHDLTGNSGGRLTDSLRHRALVAVEVRQPETATVLSASGRAPARLTLARFHAPERCGPAEVVTELVLAFPPEGTAAGGRATPPSHVTVVALLDAAPAMGDVDSTPPSPEFPLARELVTRVADRAERETRGARGAGGPLGRLHRPVLDPDQAADAGEVVALDRARYAVGFRATFAAAAQTDTTLISGVATTDTSLRALRWVVPPRRVRLHGGMIVTGTPHRKNPALRYSLRGAVTAARGKHLLLLDEISDVSARDARATAVDATSGRVVAAQPLALRCP